MILDIEDKISLIVVVGMPILFGCAIGLLVYKIAFAFMQRMGTAKGCARSSWSTAKVLMAIVLVATLGAWLATLIELPVPRTYYASGYSRITFSSLKIKTPESVVLSVLGPPLSIGVERGMQRYTFDTAGLTVDILESTGAVVYCAGISHELWDDQKVELIDITEKYGAPNSVSAENVLVYKYTAAPLKSPTANYWVREILVHPAGKIVVGKRSGIRVDV